MKIGVQFFALIPIEMYASCGYISRSKAARSKEGLGKGKQFVAELSNYASSSHGNLTISLAILRTRMNNRLGTISLKLKFDLRIWEILSPDLFYNLMQLVEQKPQLK